MTNTIPQIEPAPTGSGWRIALCGGISVTRHGESLSSPLPARQGRLVFGYLVLNRAHPVTRDVLIDVLWPENPPASPEAVLSAVLTRLRRALGDGVLLAGPSDVQLQLGSDAWIDVEAAAAMLAEAGRASTNRSFASALSSARAAADLLEPRLLPEFEGEWLDEHREEINQLRLGCLELIASSALELKPPDISVAQRTASELIRHAPYSEPGYGALMRAYAAKGAVVEAVRVFDQLRTLLRDEMGTTPSPALIALNDQLLRHEVPPRRPAVPQPGVPLPPILRAASEGALVGRDSESDSLLASWRDRAGVVFVSGEPGIGKTRLVSHVAALARADGGLVLYGRCDEEPVSSYQPFAEMLAHYLNHTDLADLRRRMPQEAPELGRIVPRFAGQLGAEKELAGDRQRLFDAVTTVLRDGANDQPMMLVLDDLHWADRSTILLLRHVLRGLHDAPVLALGTFRDAGRDSEPVLVELLASLRREGGYERIRLDGLNEDATAALVRATTEAEPSRRFSRRLRDLTGGNPFFIAETLRSVQQATTAVTPAVSDLRSARVAEGVRDVLLDRLMRRSDPAIQVLKAAAVVGRRFDLGLLAAVLDRSEDELLTAVEELIQAGLVSELSEPDTFEFSHDLVRETQYEQITSSRRARIHQRIALVLEQRPNAHSNELAHHFFEARHLLGPEPAVRHSLEAAHEAASAYAHDEAVGHYERALTAMKLLTAGADEHQCMILLELGRELEHVHDIDRSRQCFAQAAEIAKQAGRADVLADAASGFARWQRYGMVDRAAIELLEEALQALPNRPTAARAEILGRLAVRLEPAPSSGRPQRLFEQALEIARGLDQDDALLALLPLAPIVFSGPDHVELRLSLADEAASHTLGRDDPERAASAQLERFLALFELGRIDEADHALEAYSELIAGLHHAWFEWQLLTSRASRSALAGRFDEAERLVLNAVALERELDAEGTTETWAVQSFMLGRGAGRFDTVDEDAIRHCAHEHPKRPLWEALIARLAAGLGRDSDARQHLDSCLLPDRELPLTREWLPTVSILLETAVALDDRSHEPQLRRLTEPYSDRVVVVERASATWGRVADLLTGG